MAMERDPFLHHSYRTGKGDQQATSDAQIGPPCVPCVVGSSRLVRLCTAILKRGSNYAGAVTVSLLSNRHRSGPQGGSVFEPMSTVTGVAACTEPPSAADPLRGKWTRRRR